MCDLEYSRDDEKTRRILNLLFILNAAGHPVTSTQIIDDEDLGYGGERESAMKKFRRDRDELSKMGIVITEVKEIGSSETEESRWTIDRESTHIGEGILSADDASMLADALDEFIRRGNSPFQATLERIRSKIKGADPLDPSTGSKDLVRDALWNAFSRKVGVRFLYEKPGDTRPHARHVQIYGMFVQDGISYFTGLDIDRGALRTFRVDRVRRVSSFSRTYSIASDFDAGEHLFLPFDFSNDALKTLEFSFPPSVSDSEIESITRGRGEILKDHNERLIWRVEGRSTIKAAAYALSNHGTGMIPTGGSEMHAAYFELIRKTVRAHDVE